MIVDIKKIPKNRLIGNKAINLQILVKNNFNIPQTYFLVTDNRKINASDITKSTADFIGKNNIKSFAVRSSALNEDGNLKSYAGLYQTKLNVLESKLLESIIEVMLSKPLLNVYETTSENELTTNMTGVIIQEMIDADYSGVAFSVCPVEKNKNISRIEIVKGLGEALVSNKKTPTSIRFNCKTDSIYIEKQGSDKIDSSKAIEIFYLVLPVLNKIARLFKNEVDVEWAIKNGVLYVLQSRPITTLGTK